MSEGGTIPPEYLDTNRGLWDGWTEINRDSAFYDVEGFLEGRSTLNEPELELLGDPRGLRILHLQCHFGLDTLSLAREGARVTGVDFSPKAVEQARALAASAGVEARFVCSGVYELDRVLDERFDVVFTTWGVLAWLPDLDRWARVVRRFLAPGGRLILVEFHPVGELFEERVDGLDYPYFGGERPLRCAVQGSYADPDADFSHDSYQWIHPLSETLGALLAAGLRLETFREYPFSPYGCFPFTREVHPGRWELPEPPGGLPLAFGVVAARPEEEEGR